MEIFSKFAAKIFLRSQAVQAERGWCHRLGVGFVSVICKVSSYECLQTQTPDISVLSIQLNEERQSNTTGRKEA